MGNGYFRLLSLTLKPANRLSNNLPIGYPTIYKRAGSIEPALQRRTPRRNRN